MLEQRDKTSFGLREPILYWGTVLLASIFAIRPLWSVDFVPLQDLPGHLATARVLIDLGDPDSMFTGRYFRPGWLLPNALFFYVVRVLAFVMEVNTAAKVVLSAYIVLLPVSLGVFFRTCGVSRWLGLMGFWFVYNDLLGHGFISFVIGLPLFFFFLAAAHIYARDLSRRSGLIVALLLVVSFLCHAQIFLQAGLFGMVISLIYWDGWKMLLVRLWPYVLGSLPFLAWFFRFFVFPPGEGVAEVTFGGFESELGFKWAQPDRLLSQPFNNLLMRFDSQADEIALLSIGVLVLFLLWSRRGNRIADIEGDEKGLRPYIIECLTVTAVVSYFLLPLHMKGQAEISSRLVPFIFLLLPGWGALPRGRGWAIALVALMVLGTVRFHDQIADHFVEYEEREMGNVRGLIGLLDREDRLAFLRPDRQHRVVKRGASWYLDSYHMVLNGGLNRMPFHLIYPHHTVIFPRAAPPRVHEIRIHEFPRSQRARWYTHVLVYSGTRPNFHSRERGRLSLLGHTGSLWLYALHHPPRISPETQKSAGKTSPKTDGSFDLRRFRSGSRLLDRVVRILRARQIRAEKRAKPKKALSNRKGQKKKPKKTRSQRKKERKKKRSRKKKAPTPEGGNPRPDNDQTDR